MPTDRISAKNARVVIGATPLLSVNWSAKFDGDTVDVPTFEDGGYYVQIGGLTRCTVSVQGVYDRNRNPFTSLNLKHGEDIQTVQFFLNGATSPAITLPVAYVHQPEVAADVKAELKFNVTFKSQGVFTYPTGTP